MKQREIRRAKRKKVRETEEKKRPKHEENIPFRWVSCGGEF